LRFEGIAVSEKIKIPTTTYHRRGQAKSMNMFLAWGANRTYIDPGTWLSECAVMACAKQHKESYQAVFLEYTPGHYYRLQTDAEIDMAARLVFLYHTKDFDSDDWIKEAHAMQELVEQRDTDGSDVGDMSDEN
jgi:hypothetical protein